MKSIKTYFKIGIYLPVYFVQMGFTAIWPWWCGKTVLQQMRMHTQGEMGWNTGYEGNLGLCKGYVFLVTGHSWGIIHRSTFKKTNNPAVFNLHCKSDAILEHCFRADSGEGHFLSHLRSFQQDWAVWGREVSSLFAVWFGSTPGYHWSKHGSTLGCAKSCCESLGNLPLLLFLCLKS